MQLFCTTATGSVLWPAWRGLPRAKECASSDTGRWSRGRGTTTQRRRERLRSLEPDLVPLGSHREKKKSDFTSPEGDRNQPEEASRDSFVGAFLVFTYRSLVGINFDPSLRDVPCTSVLFSHHEAHFRQIRTVTCESKSAVVSKAPKAPASDKTAVGETLTKSFCSIPWHNGRGTAPQQQFDTGHCLAAAAPISYLT